MKGKPVDKIDQMNLNLENELLKLVIESQVLLGMRDAGYPDPVREKELLKEIAAVKEKRKEIELHKQKMKLNLQRKLKLNKLNEL